MQIEKPETENDSKVNQLEQKAKIKKKESNQFEQDDKMLKQNE